MMRLNRIRAFIVDSRGILFDECESLRPHIDEVKECGCGMTKMPAEALRIADYRSTRVDGPAFLCLRIRAIYRFARSNHATKTTIGDWRRVE